MAPYGDEEDVEEEREDINPYEAARLQLLERNRARLIALGIPQAVEGLQQLVPHPKAKPARRPRRSAGARPAKGPEKPTRKSSRLEGLGPAAPGPPAGVEEGSELARFVQEGECPRCGGGPLSLEARRLHLGTCGVEGEPPTEEEIAARAKKAKVTEAGRLRELELGGLLDWTSGDLGWGGRQVRATFIVIGSEDKKTHKRNHYAVKFTTSPDEGRRARTCECIDCRIRKRDCKHIRLIMEGLGVPYPYTGWPQALEAQLSAVQPAGEDDAARVRAQEERARGRRERAEAAASSRAMKEEKQAERRVQKALEGEEGWEEDEDEEADAGSQEGPDEERGAGGRKRKAAANKKRGAGTKKRSKR